jgi:leucyl/phenylalanyl-tRNA--protein transferase
MTGAELTSWTLRYGYSLGCFPMGNDDGTIEWYRSNPRALFPLEGIRVSSSLCKVIRKGTFEIRFDTAFEQVVRSCRRPDGNWITEDIIRAFTAIHHEGWAHSCECWRDGNLVGGVYGLALGSCFNAESMFHRETNASKVALWAMVEKCRELGFTIFDAQVMNPHLASLGAYEVSLPKYLRMLEKAIEETTPWSLTSEWSTGRTQR